MTKNLAEILPDGNIKVLRMVKDDGYETKIDFTLIKSKEFEMSCGACGNPVLYKQPIHLNPSFNILTAWGTMQTYYAKGSN